MIHSRCAATPPRFTPEATICRPPGSEHRTGPGLHLGLHRGLVGALIVEYEQGGEDRAAYGQGLTAELAALLRQAEVRGFSAANLSNCRQVAPANPAPIAAPLLDSLSSSTGDEGETFGEPKPESRTGDGIRQTSGETASLSPVMLQTPLAAGYPLVTPPKEADYRPTSSRAGPQDLLWPWVSERNRLGLVVNVGQGTALADMMARSQRGRTGGTALVDATSVRDEAQLASERGIGP